MKRPHCRTELPDDAGFCVSCRSAIQAEIIGANHETINPPTAKSCAPYGRTTSDPNHVISVSMDKWR